MNEIVHTGVQQVDNCEQPKQQRSMQLAPDKITKRDIGLTWLRFYFSDEIPHSYDRYIAYALMWSLMPVLRKLYKDQQDLADAYARHLLFFNTQISWGGGVISGITASLEEARANEMYEGSEISVTDDMIYNSKAGLMGALAGIGDSIDSGTVQYIFVAIALPWAQQGNPIGALFPWIAFSLYQFVIGYFFAQFGFKMGRNAASQVVGAKMQNVIDALSILGLFMMGILAASYIKITSALEFELSGKPFVIQDILNSVLPGLLPLLAVAGVYFFFVKKGLKVMQALIGLTVILAVLALIGIL